MICVRDFMPGAVCFNPLESGCVFAGCIRMSCRRFQGEFKGGMANPQEFDYAFKGLLPFPAKGPSRTRWENEHADP